MDSLVPDDSFISSVFWNLDSCWWSMLCSTSLVQPGQEAGCPRLQCDAVLLWWWHGFLDRTQLGRPSLTVWTSYFRSSFYLYLQSKREAWGSSFSFLIREDRMKAWRTSFSGNAFPWSTYSSEGLEAYQIFGWKACRLRQCMRNSCRLGYFYGLHIS